MSKKLIDVVADLTKEIEGDIKSAMDIEVNSHQSKMMELKEALGSLANLKKLVMAEISDK
ncbi:MAG: hypothetical protein FWB72_05310 [Firmicutes bacterium]|nr:hypothetical protein [Bacillota bacterium]